MPHVLIIVQNLPLPLDRRVWLEAQALRDAGYRVSVICPMGPGDPPFEILAGIELHKYPPSPQAQGVLGYAREFAESWLRTAVRARKIWRAGRFDVIQACNPPDTYWALARLFRRQGVSFVFDQHDLNPELFLSRFGIPATLSQWMQYRILLWLERMTYRSAHRVIATNRSYARIAETRGGIPPAEIEVVRSGPDTGAMRPLMPERGLVPEGRHVVAYLGIMGPQDGVDSLLRSMAYLVHQLGRRDIHLVLLGFGDAMDDLLALVDELDIGEWTTFTGRADKDMIADYLSAATVGVGPDPKSALNDVSTMNKIMEYMAFALPIITYDLTETRVSAGDAAVYVPSGDEEGFAEAIANLVDDSERRAELAVAARERVASELDWEVQRKRYVRVFDGLLGIERSEEVEPTWPQVDRRKRSPQGGLPADSRGRTAINLRGQEDLTSFAASKGEADEEEVTQGDDEPHPTADPDSPPKRPDSSQST
ncbi:MAG: glycosyltransferase family 4 protein [Actinomycetia bacterium]|nr:glycosyltransferase family 4 protein [Actinomycetes bacterium]MCH9801347.1 glycosyltransferase family 4 protein [Actinomycetes bacterium]